MKNKRLSLLVIILALFIGLANAEVQTPYGNIARTIPGKVQAEDFDNGGEGVAYHDIDAANLGGQYRRNYGVDIEPTIDKDLGYNIGWTRKGEWLEYTVNVQKAGTYTMEVRVAVGGGTGGNFHIEFGGIDKTGKMTVPNTGGWQKWQTLSKTVSLSAGAQVMRIVMDNVGTSGAIGNINYIKLTSIDSTPTPTPALPPLPVSSLVFKGDFETGNTDQWPTKCPSPSGIQTVTSPVRQGTYLAKFQLNSGDRDSCSWGGERSELATNKLSQKDGNEYYYAWSTYFPSDWKPVSSWGVITQWHTKYPLNPAVSLIMEKPVTGIQLALCTGNQDGYTSNCNPAGRSFHPVVSSIQIGKWNDFIVHIKWSSSNTGLVEVWHRLEGQTTFTKKVSLVNIPTLQTKSGEAGYITYIQQGLYRSATGDTQTIYHDGFRVGTTYESVLY